MKTSHDPPTTTNVALAPPLKASLLQHYRFSTVAYPGENTNTNVDYLASSGSFTGTFAIALTLPHDPNSPVLLPYDDEEEFDQEEFDSDPYINVVTANLLEKDKPLLNFASIKTTCYMASDETVDFDFTFITDNHEISLGLDHMKYVVQQNQKVHISGEINNSGDTLYNGIYDDNEIDINYNFQEKEGFLAFEHSDGLNYINIECRRFDNILTFKQFGVNLTEGIGIGFLLPRTNASLLGQARYDQFHLAGYGFNAVVALNLSYKRCFIQSELKGGFINMPDIRTTEYKSDRASQHFLFTQLNFLVGYSFSLSKD